MTIPRRRTRITMVDVLALREKRLNIMSWL
jgi:hypothetical protein